jgi:hypothetical protein
MTLSGRQQSNPRTNQKTHISPDLLRQYYGAISNLLQNIFLGPTESQQRPIVNRCEKALKEAFNRAAREDDSWIGQAKAVNGDLLDILTTQKKRVITTLENRVMSTRIDDAVFYILEARKLVDACALINHILLDDDSNRAKFAGVDTLNGDTNILLQSEHSKGDRVWKCYNLHVELKNLETSEARPITIQTASDLCDRLITVKDRLKHLPKVVGVVGMGECTTQDFKLRCALETRFNSIIDRLNGNNRPTLLDLDTRMGDLYENLNWVGSRRPESHILRKEAILFDNSKYSVECILKPYFQSCVCEYLSELGKAVKDGVDLSDRAVRLVLDASAEAVIAIFHLEKVL